MLCRGEALFQIGEDIVDVLGADGEADRVLVDPLLGQLLVRELGVRRRGRVDDEGFDVRDIRKQREDLERIDEGVGFLLPALDVEREDGRAAVREIALIEGVIRVIRQRWVVHLLDLRVRGEVFDDLFRVLRMAFEPERERLHALQEQERVERRARSNIARR